MASLKDVLKLALAGKNKQAHRVVGGTKRGRQLLAQYNTNHGVGNVERDTSLKGINTEGLISTRDI